MAYAISQVSQANNPSVSSQPTVALANVNRVGFIIQTQGSSGLLLRFGTGASATSFHIALQGSTTNPLTQGAIYSQMSGIVYTGIISASVASGVIPTYTFTEFS